MALVHYSGLVSQMKGKLRGAIFQAGPAGQIVRSAKNWNRTASQRFQVSKYQSGFLSAQWAALTDNQRASWEAMAKNIPTKNVFGELRIPSGYNLFTAQNKRAIYAGLPIATVPTIPRVLGDISQLYVEFHTTSALWLNWVEGFDPSYYVLCDATAGIRPGRKTAPGGWKRLGNINPTGSDGADITAAYQAAFGLIIPGSQVQIRCTVFDSTTYYSGVPVIVSTVIS